MKLKKLDPHSCSWIYIQPHKLQKRLLRINGRNLCKGGYGFFDSTKIWIKFIAPIFSNDFCKCNPISRVIFIFKSCGFLFVPPWDKPHLIHSNPKPCCRSPPSFPSDFPKRRELRACISRKKPFIDGLKK